jgi:hypothetical protein
MTSVQIAQLSPTFLAREFFRESVGQWKSQRRYYTLSKDSELQEVVSTLTVEFLEQGCSELLHLADLHQLETSITLLFGGKVTWESNYLKDNRKASRGSTIFGAKGNKLYRDRGFSTLRPITATFLFTDSKTMCLKTEYEASVFEEELKLIGKNYRTRQTIISKAGQELMIGQYLESRIS